jgi:hypothetical protein
MEKDLHPLNRSWILLIAMAAGLVLWMAGTDVYVEGDDASSIAYHLLGRNNNMQPAYTPYQGMMDKVLSIFPAREPLLREVAQDATRLAAIMLIILILALAFDWSHPHKVSYKRKALIAFVVLLAVPEFFYLGLVYSPTLVAMCLVLSAHLVLRRLFDGDPRSMRRLIIYFALSSILFGAGVAFRWNVIVYGAVIVVDLLINVPKTNFEGHAPVRMFFPVVWGISAAFISLIMIWLSGYGYLDFITKIQAASNVVNQSGTLQVTGSSSVGEILLQILLTLSPMLSPGFILFLLIGLLKVVRDRNPIGWVVLISVIGILPWLITGVPKFIITIFPALVFCFVEGFGCALDFLGSRRSRAIAYSLIFILLIGPWLIGIRVIREGTAWGPGFEIKPYDYSDVQGTKFDGSLGPGAAFPTPEGPRPLYGHAYVLLGGGWIRFVDAAAAERQLSIDNAISLKVPLVVTNWSPDYYLDDLYAMGYTTPDPFDRIEPGGFFRERRFFRGDGATINILYHEIEGADILDELEPFLSLHSTTGKIVFVGYSQTLHALYKNYPGALSALGPNSAVIDLGVLRSDINIPAGSAFAATPLSARTSSALIAP